MSNFQAIISGIIAGASCAGLHIGMFFMMRKSTEAHRAKIDHDAEEMRQLHRDILAELRKAEGGGE